MKIKRKRKESEYRKRRKKDKSSMLMKCIRSREIRKRLLITFGILVLFQFGAKLTLPFVDTSILKQMSGNNSVLSLLSMVSGGSLDQMSLFALGVGPYITASIIIQLLSSDVIPYLTNLKEQGEKGRIKQDRIIRVTALFCGTIQAFGITYALASQSVPVTGGDGSISYQTMIPGDGYWGKIAFLTLVMVAGSMIALWLGDVIEEYGIGNGVSLLIFSGIVRKFPSQTSEVVNGILSSGTSKGYSLLCVYGIVTMMIILLVVMLQHAEIRIPIYKPSSTAKDKLNYLPLKVNTPGVMPVIFASTLMMVPLQIVSMFAGENTNSIATKYLGLGTYQSILIYVILILLFSFFYTKIQIDPEKTAENLSKSKTIIPNVEPGKQTEKYINLTLNHIMVWGALGLIIVAVLPYILPLWINGIPRGAAIGGTGIIIVVGVLVECKIRLNSFIKENRYKIYL